MKKVYLIISLVSLATVSCKKNYDCVCTSTGNGASVSSTTSIRDTESKAQETCDKQGKNTTAGAGSTTSCTLE